MNLVNLNKKEKNYSIFKLKRSSLQKLISSTKMYDKIYMDNNIWTLKKNILEEKYEKVHYII